MNQFVFLLGVFIGNIFNIKYILIMQIIYILIKNDPIGEIYPRTILSQVILWIMTKNIKNILHVNNTNMYTENIHKIDDVSVVIEDITDEGINRFSPTPKLLQLLSNTIKND